MVTGILTACLFPIFLSAAQNNYQPTLKSVEIKSSKPKEPEVLSGNHYLGIYISREDLKSYLELIFTKEGLEDQIDTAKAVISCESGFQIDPPHNNSCRGIAQFKVKTFSGYCDGTLMNPFNQIDCMVKLWKLGHQDWWECYTMQKKAHP